MGKTEKQEYKFHFKIDADMKQSLLCLPLFSKMGNFSRLVTRVLTLLSPGMENKHLQGDQQFSRYKLVCDDREVARENVFVYLSDRQYRQLKILHQDLNYYSMAQLLRLVLRVFLDLAKEFGDGVESKLLELYRKWKKKRDFRKYEWKPVEELLHFIYQKPKESWFLTLYSKKFQPISIYRL